MRGRSDSVLANSDPGPLPHPLPKRHHVSSDSRAAAAADGRQGATADEAGQAPVAGLADEDAAAGVALAGALTGRVVHADLAAGDELVGGTAVGGQGRGVEFLEAGDHVAVGVGAVLAPADDADPGTGGGGARGQREGLGADRLGEPDGGDVRARHGVVLVADPLGDVDDLAALGAVRAADPDPELAGVRLGDAVPGGEDPGRGDEHAAAPGAAVGAQEDGRVRVGLAGRAAADDLVGRALGGQGAGEGVAELAHYFPYSQRKTDPAIEHAITW